MQNSNSSEGSRLKAAAIILMACLGELAPETAITLLDGRDLNGYKPGFHNDG